ncbi:hypothetical protein CMALT430_80037 [Carnobacterium maltaromaticum]|nr:hypothetical protein CMALT430_80037 [Carnobacterium maltaromaticum]
MNVSETRYTLTLSKDSTVFNVKSRVYQGINTGLLIRNQALKAIDALLKRN